MNRNSSRGNWRYGDETTDAFLSLHPGHAANRTLTSGARIFYGLLILAAFLAYLLPWPGAAYLAYLFLALYIAAILFRLLCVGMALVGRPEIIMSREELAAAGKEGWPRYSILVPLYHEAEVAAKIVRHLDRLDYPHDRLEVLLLLEADDQLTRNALAGVQLPPYFRIIDVPDTQPRTKPKACNWGLREASGEHLVIYDAEDRPDRDQLKKAAAAFRTVPAHVICLQAKLSYYNPAQNMLTRWFTIEYAAWFDLYLPGLYRMYLPIPLGGTSNHFRRRVLEEIGGWDPFNVAEDCDLGIRLDRLGYQTAMLDTTTWEEANSRLRNWVRQRSRWIKGYVQTHLVHTRNPVRLVRELGLPGTLSFLMSVGGHSLVLLVNPIIWLASLPHLIGAGGGMARDGLSSETVWSALLRPPLSGLPSLSGLAWSIAVLLFGANFLFIFFNLLGCWRRRLGLAYLLFALASPFYWILISIGAWKGFLQLFRRPHYWEKTDHGFFTEPEEA